MKTSDSISFATVPSLFQIAAFFEDFFPSGGIKQPTLPAGKLPFAEVMLSPEKLMTLLKPGKVESSAASGSETSQTPGKRTTRTAPSKKVPDQGAGKTNLPPANKFKKVEFTLKSPAAKSVKLAGDFTGWEKAAVEMMHVEDGIWFTAVPLVPGQYSYRFIVDGQWCDDPGIGQRIRNPFGTENTVIQVA